MVRYSNLSIGYGYWGISLFVFYKIFFVIYMKSTFTNPMHYSLSEKIRIIRLIRGYNEHYMALRLKISQQSYSYLERRLQKISEEQLIIITNALMVSVDFLNEFDPELFLSELQNGHDRTISPKDGENSDIGSQDDTIQLLKEQVGRQDETIRYLRKMMEKKLDRGEKSVNHLPLIPFQFDKTGANL